ncbi:MAG: ABC transporter permease [Clostridia bacterium]|nr:ABC transporter permease [Clostridia bacterium]
MMKILSLAKYDLIKLTRERTALLIIFLIPIMFTIVMGAAFGSAGGSGSGTEERKMPIGITSYDNSEVARKLIEGINRDKAVYALEVNEEELLRKVRGAEVEVGFVIPEGFGKAIEEGGIPEIKTLKLPNSVDYMAIQGILNSSLARLRIKQAAKLYFEDMTAGLEFPNKQHVAAEIGQNIENRLKGPALIEVAMSKDGAGVSDRSFDVKSQISIGVMVMFMMFSIVFSAGQVLEEKKNNTWGRMSITPTSMASIITGKVFGTFITGWLQALVLIMFGSIFMKVRWGDSLGVSVVVISLFVLTVTSIGLFLSTLVKTNSQLGIYSSVLIVCSSMLSGCYWPVEMEPEFMQRVAAFFPQYWAVKALSATVGSGLGFNAVAQPLMALAAMAVVFFTLSVFGGLVRKA